MAMRSFLIPIRGDGKGDCIMDHAQILAKRLGAHMDIVHARAQPTDLLPFGVLLTEGMKQTILEAAEDQAKEEENRVRSLFDEYCSKAGLSNVDPYDAGHDGTTVSWIERTGKQADLTGLLGRLADLVIVPKPDAELGINTLEASLMDAQALTLMCPDKPSPTLGEIVALAWNGSEQSARAIRRAIPILQKAKSVFLMTNDEAGNVSGISTAEMQNILKRNNVNAEIKVFTHEKDIGHDLLDAAMSVNADMLVMGAYSHSRRRELVMGGATHYIINNTGIPVLMLH